MKGRRTITALLVAGLLLVLLPILPAGASPAPGSLDEGFYDPSPNNVVYAVAVHDDGKILIGGEFTEVDGYSYNRIARLHSDGTLDMGFNPGTGANGAVYAVIAQPDDKVLIAGDFTLVNGTARNRIARLNANGSLDTTFNPGTGANSTIYALALQSDGRVLMGGDFSQVNGTSRGRIVRLEADGSLDSSFNPGTGANNAVRVVALQPDDKVLMGGSFTLVNGTSRGRIARLHTDGSLDTAFDPGTGANGAVHAVVVNRDDKVYIGGEFTQVDGTGRPRIARLDTDGSLETGFDPGTGPNGGVYALAYQSSNDTVFLGGDFTSYDGEPCYRVGRVDLAGGLDDVEFDPGAGANAWVKALARQSDGKLLVGGAFTQMDGQPRAYVTRLNSDGSLDRGPSPGLNHAAYAVASCQAFTSKLVLGGEFTQVTGGTRNYVARLKMNLHPDLAHGSATGGPNDPVHAMEIVWNDMAVIGGTFTEVGGTSRNGIARLRNSGSLDSVFDPGSGVSNVTEVYAVQPSGTEALIGGDFTEVDGTARNRIARLESLGSLDTTFDPGGGANGMVRAIAEQFWDDKVLIAGDFTEVDGTPRNQVARLDADGSLDTSFAPLTWPGAQVYDIVIYRSGVNFKKILVVGNFGQALRLNADGTTDSSFSIGQGANGTIRVVALQTDDKALIGGSFTSINADTRQRIARLNDDGSLDASFDTSSGANDTVYDLVIQGSTAVIVGAFTSYDGHGSCQGAARLDLGSPPVFTSPWPDDALVGVAYSHQFAASGFPLPTFRVVSGSLPPGLTLTSSGLLSGTPTTVGTFRFTVKASNDYSPSATRGITLDVVAVHHYYVPLVVRTSP